MKNYLVKFSITFIPGGGEDVIVIHSEKIVSNIDSAKSAKEHIMNLYKDNVDKLVYVPQKILEYSSFDTQLDIGNVVEKE